MSLRRTRLLKELAELKRNFDCDGINLKSEIDDLADIDELHFEIIGPEGTPFAKEHLSLEMKLTNRYPLEPPVARFKNSVRHPNIDEVSGRICLDLLRMPPEGTWKPNVSLSSVLVSIQVLLGSPNLEDPVRPDLIAEWQNGFKENITDNTELQIKRPVKTKSFSLSLSALRKKPKLQEE